MGRPKTHLRLDITLPIDMVKELRKRRKDYGPISQQIAQAVNARMTNRMRRRFLERR